MKRWARSTTVSKVCIGLVWQGRMEGGNNSSWLLPWQRESGFLSRSISHPLSHSETAHIASVFGWLYKNTLGPLYFCPTVAVVLPQFIKEETRFHLSNNQSTAVWNFLIWVHFLWKDWFTNKRDAGLHFVYLLQFKRLWSNIFPPVWTHPLQCKR